MDTGIHPAQPPTRTQRFCWAIGRLSVQGIACFRALGITPSEFVLLCFLHRHAPENPTAGTLARSMHSSRSAVSQLLRRLEKKGLIERSTSPKDRRAVCVFLTPQGEETFQKTSSGVHQQFEQALHALGEEKSETLISLLNELAGLWDARTPGGAAPSASVKTKGD